MKYLQITPATSTEPGLCVQPTMEKPIRHDDEMGLGWAERDSDWNAHIASLPKLDTTCTLPAGEWFEGRGSYEINESGVWVEYDKAVCERYFGNNKTRVIIAYVSKYQVKDLDGSWINCDKERYDRELKSYRRVYETDHTKFYCKEWDNVGYQCEEQCDRCKKADNAPEVIVPVEQKIEYCEGEDDIAFDFHKANDVEQKDEPNSEWDSNRIIGRVRNRFKELEAKGWDWRSFYNGWLEGRTDMFAADKGDREV